MTADSAPTTRPSFLDRMKDAAYQRDQEQLAAHRRVRTLVLGEKNPFGSRIGDIVKLGDDYVVEVIKRDKETGEDKSTWTTVVGGKARSFHFHTQEQAVLHLIARRYNDDDNSNHHAAFYAGRVLGIPDNG